MEPIRSRSVCNIPMGGVPGETASMLVGSIFYDRQKLVKDAAKGEFDKRAAKALLDLQHHWSEKTGNPACLDVFAASPIAIRRYLDFVIDHYDGPIMIDSSDPDVKIAGIRHLADCGLSARSIYNSISIKTTPREFDAIASCKVTAAVIMATSDNGFEAKDKIDLLFQEDGLIAKAESCGIVNCLVDPGVIDLPSLGPVMEVIWTVKEKGHLAGTAPYNAMSSWKGLMEKFGSEFLPVATAVLESLPIAWGADFIIYGPITSAPVAFPAVAMVDTIMSQILLEQGKVPGHNLTRFKIA